ncbi:hypothetical protein SLA2020_508410 [Shorea laevis]
MANDQQHYLRLVADEGFRLIEEHYGPTGRWVGNSLQYYQRPAGPKPPKPVTVVQRLVFSSTSGTYANEPHQVRPTINSGGWYVCRVPPVPTRKGDTITSDQATITYGGYLIRDY